MTHMTLKYYPVLMLAVSVLISGCGNSETVAVNNGGAMGGLVMENLSDKEIGILDIAFDGKSQFSFIVLGAGAKKTAMGRIASVRGIATVRHTEGLIGDASFSADLERVNYSGGLDRLILRLGKDGKWVLIGENGGNEVFRVVETSRVDVPATNTDK